MARETDIPGNEQATTAPDPLAVLRSRRYVGLLVLAAVLGVPISFAAYWFLKLTVSLQQWVYNDLPTGVGFDDQPTWWPLLPLAVAGLIVGLTIRYLPGKGGESPVDGFKPGGVAQPIELPGIALAALVSIGLGAVVGPEGPLVVLGGGLGYLVTKLGKRDVPAQSAMVVAATGSFAAVSTLLGSPIGGAILLLEALGLGGAMASVVLVPGLLAAGIGTLIFLGLDSITGYGTFSLAIPDLPPVEQLNGVELLWAVAVGLAAAPLCWALRSAARLLRGHVERRLVLLTPLVGVAVAGLAILYAEATDKATTDVLFSGQSDLPHLVEQSATYSVGALLLLALCKGLAYAGSLASFRGGPTFPAMFIGAVGGIALSHLPGLPLVPGVAMGIGAMTVGILRLPITSVLLTSLFLGPPGITVMPLIIIAVVVSYVVSERLLPLPPATATAPGPAAPAP